MTRALVAWQVGSGHGSNQCSGSESWSGSSCFWASRIRIHLSDVWIRIQILLSKIVRKTKMILTVLWLLLDFLSLKNDVNVHWKNNKQKNFCFKLVFCRRLEDQWRKEQDPDPHPDPLVRGMDPRIRIRGSDPHQNVMDPEHWNKSYRINNCEN